MGDLTSSLRYGCAVCGLAMKTHIKLRHRPVPRQSLFVSSPFACPCFTFYVPVMQFEQTRTKFSQIMKKNSLGRFFAAYVKYSYSQSRTRNRIWFLAVRRILHFTSASVRYGRYVRNYLCERVKVASPLLFV